MPEDISLLPKEVEQKKEQEARGQTLRKVSLVFLAASLVFSASFFVYSLVLKSQLSNLEKHIRDENSKIASLSEIELTAQDLDLRLEALKSVFGGKVYFSNLLTTLSAAVPADVSITEATAPSPEAISISGTSRSYISLAKFLLNLKDTSPPLADFEAVELRSVSLDQETGEAKFDINLSVAKGGLEQ